MFLSATDREQLHLVIVSFSMLISVIVVMILRVYAMWSRSRTILYILLFIWVVQVVTTAVFNGIYNNPGTYSSVTIVQIVDFSFCNDSSANFPRILNALIVVPRLVLSSTLMILAAFQTLKQSVAMYKATKQWKPNHYMQQLVGDGILYFLVNVLFQVNDVINLGGNPSTDTSLFLNVFAYISFYTLIPRFIISIRELYDRDTRRCVHVDTGFGVQSQSLTMGLDTTVSAMVFIDGNQGPEAEDGMDHAGDLEMACRMHGSGLNEDAPPGGRD
ncbi:hypothetical protein EV363DRAFT_1347117 [Boletus edulis]|nr:hypothetical protein EV363DRAFT_1347117 [Boletus edulis]